MAKTVAIIGVAHHGTTMVAGIYELLGVPMVGARRKERKWEDLEVVAALRDEERFAAAVAERDAAHEVWGFKSPGAWLVAPWLGQHLRDPLYLAILKDPVSVTYRRFGAVTPHKVENTVEQMRRSVWGLRVSRLPVEWLSYQEAVLAPRRFVRHLAELAGLRPTAMQVDRAVDWIQPNVTGDRRPYPLVSEHLEAV